MPGRRKAQLIAASLVLSLVAVLASSEPPRNHSRAVPQGAFPARVHVFEDFETDIEKRWIMAGKVATDNLPESKSSSVRNQRACQSTETKDFDRQMVNQNLVFQAVIFNPVPGPPMGGKTRLSFRYWLKGTDELRVQIYSLTNNYHRHLVLTGLPRDTWQDATVDMTAARRPDGSGGPLAADERIDDIQFYVNPAAELAIDDIVLYEAAEEGERRPFPRRIIFTGWFDTGQQGREWPGDFAIVPHEKPGTWKCAKSVENAALGKPWLRVHLRGLRPLSRLTSVRFRYKLTGEGPIRVALKNSHSGESWYRELAQAQVGAWAEATLDFEISQKGAQADELHVLLEKGRELLLDDLLIFEPGTHGD